MLRKSASLLCLLLLMATGTLFAATVKGTATGPWWTPTGTATEAQLAQILGPTPMAHWNLSGGASEKDGGPFTIQNDPLLGQPVIVCGQQPVTLVSQTDYQNIEASCRFRMVSTPQVTGQFFVLRILDPANPGTKFTQIYLPTNYNKKEIYLTISDQSKQYVNQTYFTRAYDAVQPTWPDSVRIPLERDMNSLPYSQDKWLHLRYQMRKDRVRVWVDDRLVADRTDGSLRTSGQLQVSLMPGTRLADMTVHAIPAVPDAFETVPMNGYVRDRALVKNAAVANGSLPFGQLVTVHGVPFNFATRTGKNAPDHLDISRSLTREGAVEGYFGTWSPRYGGSFYVDPGAHSIAHSQRAV